MFRWEYNDPQIQAAAESLPAAALVALTAFMEAVVFDPNEYGRTPGEPVGRALRYPSFGGGRGVVTIQIYEPELLVLVLAVQWFG